MIAGLFRNWRFRTARPAFVPGEEIRAYLTGFDPATGRGEIRIGDTVITALGARAEQLDQFVTLCVEQFDQERGTGAGTVR